MAGCLFFFTFLLPQETKPCSVFSSCRAVSSAQVIPSFKDRPRGRELEGFEQGLQRPGLRL